MPSATILGPSGGQARQFFRWFGALFGLLGLVLGIPAAFLASHVTPPLGQLGHLIVNPGQALHYLNGSLTDSAVAKSVTLVAWMVWLWLFFCVAVEMVAAIRGRPALHLPVSRHVQSLVTALVGASMAFVPLGKVGLPMRLHAAPAAIHGSLGHLHTEPPIDHVPLRNDDGKAPTARLQRAVLTVEDEIALTTSATMYLVQSGDTLWSIAERELGSPLHWPEIADLNYGRVQPDGEALTDAHWIYPGWELMLPTSMSPSTAVVNRLPAAAPESDPLTSVASGRSIVPSFESLTRGAADHEIRDVAQNASYPRSSASNRTDPTEANDAPHPAAPLPIAPIGYGVLGAGVIALLERMRRVQRRYRPNGLRIALPDGDLVALERRLRVDSDPDGLEIIDLGLRALVVHSLRCEMPPPQAALVRLGDDALEIVLDPGSVHGKPPAPFISDASRTSWILPRDHSTIQAIRRDPDVVQMDAPFPAMVTLGHDEFGLALVDLEQAASVDVTGANAEGILRTIAVDIATAKWADQVELVLVGFDRDLDALERVNYVPAIGDVVPKVVRRVRERTALLASVGHRANWEIRWAEGGDSWDLCVIICAQAVVDGDRGGAADLIRTAGQGGLGLAVVLGADTGLARWRLEVDDGLVALKANDAATAAFRTEPVDSEMSLGLASLVQIASQLDGVPPDAPPYDKLQVADAGQEVDADQEASGSELAHEAPIAGEAKAIDGEPAAAVREGPEVQVRVLGPIEIEGAARPFTRAWAVELIVYLALHRNGASSDQWATALWPDRVMAAASLHSTASAARRSLGTSLSGEDHLPRAHGRLSLGPSVGSDWTRFEELSCRDDPESWRLALELIRGRPFEGLRAPDWCLLEGIAANVEAVVVDLASRYAEVRLSEGDPSGAEWAARQGLRVSAYDERLYRILLRAADAAGNPAGVESVMSELVRLVAEDIEPYDAVHPETLELYRSLSRRPDLSLNR